MPLNFPTQRVIQSQFNKCGLCLFNHPVANHFAIEVQPWVKPGEQPFYVVARIETTSPQRQDFAYTVPILLTIKAKETTASRERQ